MNIYKLKIYTFLGVLIVALFSCRKFIEIEPPKNTLIKKTVFAEDATAMGAMNSVYALMNSSGFASGNTSSLKYLTGLSADELQLYSTSQDQVQFATNSLLSTTSGIGSLWLSAYSTIYQCNSILEGVSASTSLTSETKQQLEGEGKFVRAFCFFYLTNLYGEIPLSLTTDYKVNSILPKVSTSLVYEQIINDLKEAQVLLANDYSFSAGERVKPNKWAATAMLARVYLYKKDWVNAEIEATKVINNIDAFELQPLNSVFLKNSKEAIWQFNNNALNANDVSTFTFSTRPTNAALYQSFFNSFATNDQRRSNWILVKTSAGVSYYQPNKYKAPRNPPVTNPITAPTEYSTVLRLAEQFLIRAEARAQQQGKVLGLNGAEGDLNIIRARAGVANTTASDKDTMLRAIEEERFFELFTEWGHRWLDLKRTGRTNPVLSSLKGSNWQDTDQLYPIPQEQLNNNPSMKDAQNPGYN